MTQEAYIPNLDFAEQHFYPIRNRAWVSPTPVPIEETFVVPFANEGAGINMNVLGSPGEPVDFIVTPPEDHFLLLSRMVFWIRGNRSRMRPDRFGGLDQLPNGCKIALQDQYGVVQAGDNMVFRTNTDWIALSGSDTLLLPFRRREVLVVSWPSYKLGYSPVLQSGQQLRIRIRDDLRDVEEFRGVVTARKVAP